MRRRRRAFDVGGQRRNPRHHQVVVGVGISAHCPRRLLGRTAFLFMTGLHDWSRRGHMTQTANGKPDLVRSRSVLFGVAARRCPTPLAAFPPPGGGFRFALFAWARSGPRSPNACLLGMAQGLVQGVGDDELLVRAPAMRKSEGPEKFPRGRPPGPLWARGMNEINRKPAYTYRYRISSTSS